MVRVYKVKLQAWLVILHPQIDQIIVMLNVLQFLSFASNLNSLL